MQELDDYIKRVKGLPATPRVLPELLALLRRENVDSGRIVKLIAIDPALTTNVLRVCNSAAYAGSSPISDLQEAVTRLGFWQIYQVVVAVAGSQTLGPAQKGYGLDQGELWKHSVCAALAAQIAAKHNREDDNLVFTATLLHDVGKIVLADALEGKYAKLLEDAQLQQHSLLEMEKKLLGVQHAEIGGRLLQKWNFPENLVSAVWFHHQPAAAAPHQKLAAYVYLGNMIAYFMGHGYGHHAFALRGRAEVLDILQIKPDELPVYMIRAFEQFAMMETLFNLSA